MVYLPVYFPQCFNQTLLLRVLNIPCTNFPTPSLRQFICHFFALMSYGWLLLNSHSIPCRNAKYRRGAAITWHNNLICDL